MSTHTFLTDVALARRQLATYDSIRAEVHPLSRDARRLKWFFVWALWPLIALLPLGGFGSEVSTLFPAGLGGWAARLPAGSVGLILILLVLLGYHLQPLAGIGQVLRLNAFEALRAPSRRSLYVARLSRLLPWLLWLGVCAAGSAAWGARFEERPWLSVAYLAVVLLVPVFSLGLFGALVVLLRWHIFNILFIICFLPAFFIPLLRLVVPTLPDAGWLEDTPAALAIPAAFAGLTLGLLVLQVWAVTGMEPLRQDSLGNWQTLQATATSAALASNRQPSGPSVLLRRTEPVHLGPSVFVHGTGLGLAARYRAFAYLRYNIKGSFQSKGYLWIWLPLILLSVATSPEQFTRLSYLVWFIAWSPLFAGPILALEEPRRLYLLGVDYRAQLLFRLRVFWLTPGTLLTVVAMGAIVLFSTAWALALALGAASLGLAIVREGWFGWPSEPPKRDYLIGVLVVLGLFALALVVTWVEALNGLPVGLGTAPGRMLLFATCATISGGYAIIRKLRVLDDRTLRRQMAA
jgi:hypothetical protein